MGTAPPSKPVETPTRPFERYERRVCLAAPIVRKKKMRKNTTLIKLIARRDWQKVLIRSSLFPTEISKKQRMEWYGVKWEILPLHLACALNPPAQVIAKLLLHYADAAKLPMLRTKPTGEDIPRVKTAYSRDTDRLTDLLSFGISTVANETGAFPSESRSAHIKKHRRNFARLINDKGNGVDSISVLQKDFTSSISLQTEQKPSPSKTLPTAHDDLSVPPSLNAFSRERKKLRGKLSGFMGRSKGGSKGKGKRLLFPSESSWSEEPSYVKKASLQTAYSSLQDCYLSSPINCKTRGAFHRGSMHHVAVGEDMSWAPSAVESSYSLDEGSPGLSLEDSLPDEYMEMNEDGSQGSLSSFLNRQGAFLQLSLTGGLCVARLPKEIHVPSDTVHPTAIFAAASQESPPEDPLKNQQSDVNQKVTDVELEELLEKADEFLPLHIACLYQASPEVIKHLLDAYPLGTQVSNASFGMLPVHMICASLTLPPPTCAPKKGASLERLNLDDDAGKTSGALKRLLDTFPEGRLCPSQHNGMTPRQYVQASMEDGDEKVRCLNMLSQYLHGYEEEFVASESCSRHSFHETEGPSDERESNATGSRKTLDVSIGPNAIGFVPSIIQCDNASLPHSELCSDDYPPPKPDCEEITPLHTRLINQECLQVLDEDPVQAKKWHQVVNVDHVESLEDSLPWKTLPIHDACSRDAPPETIKALISCHPQALAIPDPQSGFLPLHMTCRCEWVADETIVALIDAYPDAVKTHDLQGCLPLHLACMKRNRLSVIKYLVASHPEATCTRDCRGKLPVDYAQEYQNKSNEGETAKQVVDFLESLPSEVVAPKHRRDCVGIISNGKSSIIRYSHTSSRNSHKSGNGFQLTEREV